MQQYSIFQPGLKNVLRHLLLELFKVRERTPRSPLPHDLPNQPPNMPLCVLDPLGLLSITGLSF
jgi:hypothetical protein